MEEADALSDRIAVLVSGKLNCIGTPLYLKNNFGEGYKFIIIEFKLKSMNFLVRLKIFAESENIKEVETIVSRNLKTSKIVDYGEGNSSILFQIPHLDELKNFFE